MIHIWYERLWRVIYTVVPTLPLLVFLIFTNLTFENLLINIFEVRSDCHQLRSICNACQVKQLGCVTPACSHQIFCAIRE